MANRRIGVISGSAYFDQFDYDESLRKEQVLREDQLIRMLVEGRIDVAIGWEIPFEYSLERFNRKNRIVKSPFYPLDELPKEKVEALSSHFAFSKKTKMLRHKKMFEETLKTLLDDGTVDEIIMRNLSSVE